MGRRMVIKEVKPTYRTSNCQKAVIDIKKFTVKIIQICAHVEG